MIIDASRNNVTLPKLSDPILEIYNKQGRGLVDMIAIEFNSTSVIIVIEVDGVEIMNFDFKDITALPLRDTMQVYRNSNTFFYSPKLSINFKNSFIIKAQANGNSTSRILDNYMILYNHNEAFRD